MGRHRPAAALVAGVLAGHFLLGGAGTVALNGRTALSAGELDSVVATYTEGGTTTSVTAREVLEEIQGGSEPSANEDGTYDVPPASDILSYVQNEVILADAEARGLTATEDEVNDFVTNNLGASSVADVASSYGIDEDAAYEMIADTVVLTKLQNEVVSVELPTRPTAPEEPAEGEEDSATAEYASYVIALLGDEWDADANGLGAAPTAPTTPRSPATTSPTMPPPTPPRAPPTAWPRARTRRRPPSSTRSGTPTRTACSPRSRSSSGRSPSRGRTCA